MAIRPSPREVIGNMPPPVSAPAARSRQAQSYPFATDPLLGHCTWFQSRGPAASVEIPSVWDPVIRPSLPQNRLIRSAVNAPARARFPPKARNMPMPQAYRAVSAGLIDSSAFAGAGGCQPGKQTSSIHDDIPGPDSVSTPQRATTDHPDNINDQSEQEQAADHSHEWRSRAGEGHTDKQNSQGYDRKSARGRKGASIADSRSRHLHSPNEWRTLPVRLMESRI